MLTKRRLNVFERIFMAFSVAKYDCTLIYLLKPMKKLYNTTVYSVLGFQLITTTCT